MKVWISYALFEGARIGGSSGDEEDEEEAAEENIPEENKGNPEKAREVFERGYKDLRGKEWTDVRLHFTFFSLRRMSLLPNSLLRLYSLLQRVALLEAWKSFEGEHGSPAQVEKVQGLMPQATKRRRTINDAGDQEECTSRLDIPPIIVNRNSSLRMAPPQIGIWSSRTTNASQIPQGSHSCRLPTSGSSGRRRPHNNQEEVAALWRISLLLLGQKPWLKMSRSRAAATRRWKSVRIVLRLTMLRMLRVRTARMGLMHEEIEVLPYSVFLIGTRPAMERLVLCIPTSRHLTSRPQWSRHSSKLRKRRPRVVPKTLAS